MPIENTIADRRTTRKAPCGHPQSDSPGARGGCNNARCGTCYPKGWQPTRWAGETVEEHALNEASELFHNHPSHPSSCEVFREHYNRPCPCEEYKS